MSTRSSYVVERPSEPFGMEGGVTPFYTTKRPRKNYEERSPSSSSLDSHPLLSDHAPFLPFSIASSTESTHNRSASDSEGPSAFYEDFLVSSDSSQFDENTYWPHHPSYPDDFHAPYAHLPGEAFEGPYPEPEDYDAPYPSYHDLGYPGGPLDGAPPAHPSPWDPPQACHYEPDSPQYVSYLPEGEVDEEGYCPAPPVDYQPPPYRGAPFPDYPPHASAPRAYPYKERFPRSEDNFLQETLDYSRTHGPSFLNETTGRSRRTGNFLQDSMDYGRGGGGESVNFLKDPMDHQRTQSPQRSHSNPRFYQAPPQALPPAPPQPMPPFQQQQAPPAPPVAFQQQQQYHPQPQRQDLPNPLDYAPQIQNKPSVIQQTSLKLSSELSLNTENAQKPVFKQKEPVPYKKHMIRFRSKQSARARQETFKAIAEGAEAKGERKEGAKWFAYETDRSLMRLERSDVMPMSFHSSFEILAEGPANGEEMRQWLTSSQPTSMPSREAPGKAKEAASATAKNSPTAPKRMTRTSKRKVPWKKMTPELFMEVFNWETTQSRVKQSEIESKFNVNRSTYYRWKKKFYSQGCKFDHSLQEANGEEMEDDL